MFQKRRLGTGWGATSKVVHQQTRKFRWFHTFLCGGFRCQDMRWCIWQQLRSRRLWQFCFLPVCSGGLLREWQALWMSKNIFPNIMIYDIIIYIHAIHAWITHAACMHIYIANTYKTCTYLKNHASAMFPLTFGRLVTTLSFPRSVLLWQNCKTSQVWVKIHDCKKSFHPSKKGSPALKPNVCHSHVLHWRRTPFSGTTSWLESIHAELYREKRVMTGSNCLGLWVFFWKSKSMN